MPGDMTTGDGGARTAPLLLVADGNSLLHRAYHAFTGWERDLADGDGRPVWALRGLFTFLARAAARVRPDALLVGFDCTEESTRQLDYAGYKAHRPAKPADLLEQLRIAPELLADAGVPVVVPRGFEADDVLASGAGLARAAGWSSVLVTSDRDAFTLIDATTSVLRLRNGGVDESPLITAAELAEAYGVAPEQYRDLAALRGDTSDNLPGVPGIGGKTAARLLAAYGTLDAAWAAVDRYLADQAADQAAEASAAGGDLRRLVGARALAGLARPDVRAQVERNLRLMRMRTDLPLPAVDELRLPLDLTCIREALRRRGIALGPSLWALTGGDPPPPGVAPEEPIDLTVPVRPRTARSRRVPGEGQMALF